MPDDLGDLSLLLAPSPGEPGPPPAGCHLAAGRAALRRRRLAAGTATLVALGVAGAGAAAVGSMTPSTRSVDDPAGRPTSSATRSTGDASPDPSPDRAAAGSEYPLLPEVDDHPDLIGPTRTATPREAETMNSFGNAKAYLSATDGALVVLPGWRVAQRIDDPASLEVLNLSTEPDDIADAVAVEVVPLAGTRGRPNYYLLDRGTNEQTASTSQPVSRLSGSLGWWTLQQTYADTPLNNGTPGRDVRFTADGSLRAESGTVVLEQVRDPDLGSFASPGTIQSTAARVQLADGRTAFVIAQRGPDFSGLIWFEPNDPPDDVAGFTAILRDTFGGPLQ